MEITDIIGKYYVHECEKYNMFYHVQGVKHQQVIFEWTCSEDKLLIDENNKLKSIVSGELLSLFLAKIEEGVIIEITEEEYKKSIVKHMFKELK